MDGATTRGPCDLCGQWHEMLVYVYPRHEWCFWICEKCFDAMPK